jgi:hypothetical protein
MLNQFTSWSVIAKWAAGSGVFGLIVYFLVDEAAFRKQIAAQPRPSRPRPRTAVPVRHS